MAIHKRSTTRNRVVVTGLGVISPLGIGSEETWRQLLGGNSGINPITGFDAHDFLSRIAGEVKGFDATQYFEKKELKKTARFIQFAVAAAEMALSHSGVDAKGLGERIGVCVGSGIGGTEIIEREHKTLLQAGPSRMSPFFLPASLINLASGQISIRTGARGPNLAMVTACTSSAHSIGESFEMIRRGRVDAMICGGAEACVTPLYVGGFCALRALSTCNDAPHQACRPWDEKRDGFVIAEGASILILEEMQFALQRGANILAEVVGYAATSDAFHITAPPEDGSGADACMRNAMADAAIEPTQVNYINAHATSTLVGDLAETRAIKQAFGEHAQKLAISSTKSMTGHLLGAAGALEAAITVLAVRDQIAPPTINLESAAPGCDLDYVPQRARPMGIDCALSNSFGFGGTNATLVFRHPSQLSN